MSKKKSRFLLQKKNDSLCGQCDQAVGLLGATRIGFIDGASRGRAVLGFCDIALLPARIALLLPIQFAGTGRESQ